MTTPDERVTIAGLSDTLACNIFTGDVDGVEYWVTLDGWKAADVRNSTVARTGADGDDQSTWWAGNRDITITGTHLAATEAARYLADQRVVSLLWRQDVTIICGGYQASGRLNSRPTMDAEGTNCEWQAVVRCPDSALYSTVLKSLLLGQVGSPTAGLHWGGLHWGGLHWGSGSASTLQGVATNAGNERTPAIYQLAGPFVNPAVLNAATGGYMRFLTTLVAGEVLTIDTANNTATLNGTPWLHTRDPLGGLPADLYLAKGDNPISFTADTLDPAATAAVSWRDAIA